jgi:glutathione synthase/RimK-type ligase-like ATP-grasp enzyme
VAIAACEAFPNLHDDWPLLRAALGRAGIDGRPAVWSDPDIDWSAFDLVVVNGAWDNVRRASDFLAWVDRLADEIGVQLVNRAATLRWNIDKRYLRELAARGVPIVPTTWVEPGTLCAADSSLLPDGEVVVKPTLSGGGFQTARHAPGEHDDALAHVAALTAQGLTAMVQPYVDAVDREGETGLVFLGGSFSHAIHKDPMIRPGAGPRDSLIDNQVVVPSTASAAQLELGRRAVAVAEELTGPTTYARVDMVELGDGMPAILELELLDPVLFHVADPPSADRFAGVLADRLRASRH